MAIFDAFQDQIDAFNNSEHENGVSANLTMLVETTRRDQVEKMGKGQHLLLHADLAPAADGNGNIMTTRLRNTGENNTVDDLLKTADALIKRGGVPVVFVGEKDPEGNARDDARIAQMAKAVVRMASRRGLGEKIKIATNSPKVMALLKDELAALAEPAKAAPASIDSLIMMKPAKQLASEEAWLQSDGNLADDLTGTSMAISLHRRDFMKSGKKLYLGKDPEGKISKLDIQLASIAGYAAKFADKIKGAKPVAAITSRTLRAPIGIKARPTKAPRQFLHITQGPSFIR